MSKLKQIIKILFPKHYKCSVCGKKTTLYHMSFSGQIPFYVCKKHHKETTMCLAYDPEYGMNRMGLMWVETNEWVK